MKFFFPDAHDLVDPSFDFGTERREYRGSRQQSQLYAHEALGSPPYDGMLISKAMVDGRGKGVRYSFAQTQRLRRIGAREFLRLDHGTHGKHIATMGDCGSFSYVNEEKPPFQVDEVIDFYIDAQFDYGIAVDHVILGYNNKLTSFHDAPKKWRERFDITLSYAQEFFDKSKKAKVRFKPVGAVQGWNPESYARGVTAMQEMGYDYIALGGMVPLKNHEVLASLEAIHAIRRPSTRLHLLGITRLEELKALQTYGVYSFDSTSPLKKAFMDDKDNYYTADRTYTAIRVPQVGENTTLKKRILSGEIDQRRALTLEKNCMQGLKAFENGGISVEFLVDHLREYEALWHGEKDDSPRYRETLTDAPWRNCPCGVCKQLGIHVLIFRGAERNRRRGFHNLHALRDRLDRDLSNLN
jgi:hypothetical protein